MALEESDLEQIARLITTAMGEGLKPVLGRLDKVESVEPPDFASLIATAMDGQGKSEEEPGQSDETTARLRALEAQLEEQKTATKTAADNANTESMLSALRTKLIGKNIPANRVKHAIASLHHSDGRISMKDGQPVIRFDRESTGGKYTDHLGLDTGLDEWLGTDDGKSFLPAKQISGADVHSNSRHTVVGPKGKVNTGSLISQTLTQAQRQ